MIWDVLYIILLCIFFAVGAAFTRGCDKLFMEETND